MDRSGERGPKTKTPAEDRRRLLAVGRADPFLVTKLPQNGTVSNGIVKLEGGGVLGFAHQPLPEGTRVRVAYQEWLYAERLPDEGVPREGIPREAVAAEVEVEEGGRSEGARVDGGRMKDARVEGDRVEDAPETSRAGEGGSGVGVAEFSARAANVGKASLEEPSRQEANTEAASEQVGNSPDETVAGEGPARDDTRRDAQPSEDENGFPDDLAQGRREVPSVGEDGERKSWTDAFGTGTRREPDPKP